MSLAALLKGTTLTGYYQAGCEAETSGHKFELFDPTELNKCTNINSHGPGNRSSGMPSKSVKPAVKMQSLRFVSKNDQVELCIYTGYGCRGEGEKLSGNTGGFCHTLEVKGYVSLKTVPVDTSCEPHGTVASLVTDP